MDKIYKEDEVHSALVRQITENEQKSKMIKNGSLKVESPADPKAEEEEEKLNKEVAALRKKMIPASSETEELKTLRKRFEKAQAASKIEEAKTASLNELLEKSKISIENAVLQTKMDRAYKEKLLKEKKAAEQSLVQVQND